MSTDEINRICEESLREELPRIMDNLMYEYKMLKGELPMPQMPPIRIPFTIRKTKEEDAP